MTTESEWDGAAGETDLPYLAEKGFKSTGDLLTSYRELERYQGNSIALPDDKASDDDWAKIYNRLGRPEKADAYDFGDLSKVDDDGKAQIEWFRKNSHELGLSQKQAAGILSRFSEFGATRAEADGVKASKAAEEAMAALHTEWGADKDKNTALVERGIKALGLSQADVDALTATPAGKVALQRAMAAIAPKLGEDVQIGQRPGGGNLTLSKADAQAKIDGIYGDPEHPYHKGEHPGHGAAVQIMREYVQAANPEEAAA